MSDSGKISLEGLNKADVLAVLYNASRPQGLGFLNYDKQPMTREEAEKYLAEGTDFDYLKGRVMKVDLSGEELDPRLYDRDNGEGSAGRAISTLRSSGDTNAESVQKEHKEGLFMAAEAVKSEMDKELTITKKGGVTFIEMGASDVSETLRPAVKKALSEEPDA